MNLRVRIVNWIARLMLGKVTVRVDDSQGWQGWEYEGHDREPGEQVQLYQDALLAWRRNPVAWRIVGIVKDYVLGDGITLSSDNEGLDAFIRRFWTHRKNRMALRLESILDELTRAGDIFPILFRNPEDGMSYLRFLTKDEVERIETAENDRETEIIIWQKHPGGLGDPIPWYTPDHPDASSQEAVILHYAVNRPVGALYGEGDLVSLLPWLHRYSRMLEDRLRLHSAVRAFLWFITVPSTQIEEKKKLYARTPEAGQVIVKDEHETWEVQSPNLRGMDAQHDIRAAFRMILSGSGFPAHWMGDQNTSTLATARATQRPTERHLSMRQKYFVFILKDILFHAYQRAAQIGKVPPLESDEYEVLFHSTQPDISREDNLDLAGAAHKFTQAMHELEAQMPGDSKTFRRLVLGLTMKFAGETLPEGVIEQIIREGSLTEDDANTGKEVG